MHDARSQNDARPKSDTKTNTSTMTDKDDSTDSDLSNDADSNAETTTFQPPHDHTPDDDLEPWTEWIRRSTHEAEERMKKLHLEDWVAMQRRRKWRWAKKVATDTTTTWTTTALHWVPTLDPQLCPRRQTGWPKLRWSDDINNYLHQLQLTTQHTHKMTDVMRMTTFGGETTGWTSPRMMSSDPNWRMDSWLMQHSSEHVALCFYCGFVCNTDRTVGTQQ